MNGLSEVKVGDKIVGFRNNTYITATFTVVKILSTLIVAEPLNFIGPKYKFRIRIKDGTSIEDGHYTSVYYYADDHPVIVTYRKSQQEEKELIALKNQLTEAMNSFETKFDLLAKLEEIVKKNQLTLAL
jgi:acetoacetate decarboxylase